MAAFAEVAVPAKVAAPDEVAGPAEVVAASAQVAAAAEISGPAAQTPRQNNQLPPTLIQMPTHPTAPPPILP